LFSASVLALLGVKPYFNLPIHEFSPTQHTNILPVPS
jgi:hypothetical protein